MPAGTPSLRLLADKTAEVLAGMAHAIDGLVLLTDHPAPPRPGFRGARLRVPDWLPGLVHAARAFLAIGAVELFWILTAWPNGASAIIFTAVPVLLFAPRAEQAYAIAVDFMIGVGLATLFAAIIKFAVLPGQETFGAFSIAIGLYLVPAGILMALGWRPVVFVAMVGNFVPLLAPANQMSYDTAQFYNSALAIVGGCGVGALSFRLVPPLSPAFRTRRLLALTLRDLRRLAMDRTPDNWEGHILGRLAAMPAEATPLQRAQLLAALSLGTEIIRLRPVAVRFGLRDDLESALAALAQGESAIAIARLGRLDQALHAGTETEAMGGRGTILAISEVVTEHADYFDAGPPG
jgi:uncharacterized membrane protein YccC